MKKPVLLLIVFAALSIAAGPPAPLTAGEEVLLVRDNAGSYGGRLTIAVRTEPRTVNPVIATDVPSRDVIGRMHADLIHINRQSQQTEEALARSWTRSPDGREYTLKLRKGIRFSDGHAFTADDVVFTFQVLLDERVASPHRDLLIVGGKPIVLTRVDAFTVRMTLAQPYAAAERIFDSIAILPRHLLQAAYEKGALAQAWTLNAAPGEIAGLGPYRLKEYVAGQRVVLERNPYYWKADASRHRLPYLDELHFTFVGSEDAQVIRFQSGDSDVLSRVSAPNFVALGRAADAARYQLKDLGPSLEYNFLFFNQNNLAGKTLPEVAARQAWFGDLRFRHAVSRAIDREGIARLVYRGRGTPLWGNVSPGNRLWINKEIPRPPRALDQARALLEASGFSWSSSGALRDGKGQPVTFTIITSASNAQRTEMATLVQDDLKQLGMDVKVVPLEFRALLDRVFQTFDYDASILGFGGGDADPNGEMNVWLSRGSNHLWRLGDQPARLAAWETEVDALMERQLVTLDYGARKRMYDRVQALVAEHVPFIFLGTPNVLVAARADLGNFQPTILEPYTLSNVEQLFLRPRLVTERR